MLTKGLIVAMPSTKYGNTDNTCDVRLPVFENTSSSNQVIAYGAQFVIQPGLYGQYQINDPVWVSFEEDDYEDPVILGKVFTGNSSESSTFRQSPSSELRKGVGQFSELTATNDATLPVSTVFAEYPNKTDNAPTVATVTTFSARQLFQRITALEQELTQVKQELLEMKLASN